jgi:hypothetical protein
MRANKRKQTNWAFRTPHYSVIPCGMNVRGYISHSCRSIDRKLPYETTQRSRDVEWLNHHWPTSTRRYR